MGVGLIAKIENNGSKKLWRFNGVAKIISKCLCKINYSIFMVNEVQDKLWQYYSAGILTA